MFSQVYCPLMSLDRLLFGCAHNVLNVQLSVRIVRQTLSLGKILLLLQWHLHILQYCVKFTTVTVSVTDENHEIVEFSHNLCKNNF